MWITRIQKSHLDPAKKTNKSLVVDDIPYTNFSEWKDFAENEEDYFLEYTPEIKAQKIIEVTSKIIEMFETKYGATKNIQKIIEKIFGPDEDNDYDDKSSDGEDEENGKEVPMTLDQLGLQSDTDSEDTKSKGNKNKKKSSKRKKKSSANSKNKKEKK